MNKKIKLGAIVLFALLCASPVHAFDWFDNLIGSSITVLGPGGGGGDPGVEPVMTTAGGGAGGGDPGVDPE